jgi:hypothetical protein
MNGFHPSTNFIGALGEYPIYDYINENILSIKHLIDGTSNTKIDETGLQVYHKDILNPLTSNGWVNVESRLEQHKNSITSIQANISGLEGEITGLQGEIATNTAAIADITPIVTANTVAIGGLTPLVGGHTIAIGSLIVDVGNCLKKANIDAGDIGLYQTIGGAFLNIVYNTNQFKVVPVLGTNRELNLKDEYANLPTTKNNKITWNTPLNYDTASDTASIDLSSYYTIAQTNTAINSNLSFYVSSNTFNNTMTNYTTNVSLSNQLYMSSNTVANLYVSSNVFSNVMLNYVTNVGLSNQLYISSNTVANLYVSSNVFSNVMLNYVTNVGLSNQLYISSNVLSKYLTPYTTSNFISSSYLPKVFTNSNRDIYFDTPIQILSNTQPNKSINSALMVGDGGRLLINGTYKLNNGASMNITQIGVADNSASGGGLKNTSITLYERGQIVYYGAVTNTTMFAHSFIGKVQMDNLYVTAIKSATNLVLKSTIMITADQLKDVLEREDALRRYL